ncbi:MAG: CRISPR-associated protein Cas5 [Pelotomaculum sp. PtaB.Bin013]|uniref:pre-crRNA processing endonuclease n=1 Tax=Pelotomaculum isophthalicicum JI TaxID=947010 RepID=A0A9X4H0Z3_9FIRM|nr:type I-C CRISPR-associated protein Cas5c [Pelotomaculum isophthalicicum]MDF9407201.1 type I-C CRISPR-associated protein Cas5c [Pelotomaculum isophthalicicum JI]OPX90845.1 MAG: CRISPR-associated protein Cas5 [Pelotomaculum sp. PtaB.Bin013]
MEKKRNTVEFLVRGDRALFSDPVTRVGGEKTSYYVPTYEALKGVLASVYWKPTIIWIIDAVRVMNVIQTASEGIRTKSYNGGNDLSIYTYLKNVCYQVSAHFVWNENRPELSADRDEHKHHNIARRMIERGGRRDIFLGARECHGQVEPCVFGEGTGAYDSVAELNLGYMFHGFTYADEAVRDAEKGHMSVRFHHVIMKKGIIEFPHPEEIPDKDRRILHEMSIKPFGVGLGNFLGINEFTPEEVSQ